MARLIDADALFPDANDQFGEPIYPTQRWETSLKELRTYIERQPTIDPVKRGHWVKLTGYAPNTRLGKHNSSVCGGHAPHDQWGHERMPMWCCGCGAMMNEEVSNADS